MRRLVGLLSFLAQQKIGVRMVYYDWDSTILRPFLLGILGQSRDDTNNDSAAAMLAVKLWDVYRTLAMRQKRGGWGKVCSGGWVRGSD